MDQEAHGMSMDINNPAFVGSCSSLIKNGVDFVNHIADTYKVDRLPMFLFGHAMGATTVLEIILSGDLKMKIEGVIITSPAFRARQAPNSIIRGGFTVARNLPFFGEVIGSRESAKIEVTHLTSVKEVQDHFSLHQEKRFFSVNNDLGKAIIDMGENTLSKASKFTTPMLILQATGDQVTDAQATHRFVMDAKLCPKTYIEFPCQHDLLHDVFVYEVEHSICMWIYKQMGREPKSSEDLIGSLREDIHALQVENERLKRENQSLRIAMTDSGKGDLIKKVVDQDVQRQESGFYTKLSSVVKALKDGENSDKPILFE
jgi:alpha-beta hydrolase superfamily lysophospholipase